MEIIFELLAQIFVFLFQAIFEIILQTFFELLVELGFRSFKKPLRKRKMDPFLASFGYLIFGCIAGGISLVVFPNLFVRTVRAQLINLFFTPVCAGLIMSLIGSFLRRKGRDLIRLETFTYGALFAFAMATIRFILGN